MGRGRGVRGLRGEQDGVERLDATQQRDRRARCRDARRRASFPRWSQAENEAALRELAQRGVTVTRLTATGRAAFAAATRGVYDKWAATVGADLVRAAEAAVKGTPLNRRGSSERA